MSWFKSCFGIRESSPSTGGLSYDDMKRMVDMTKRNNQELKNLIHRLEDDLEFEERTSKSRTPASTVSKTIYGWVKILRSDEPKVWRSAWAVLENGHLQFYRGESSTATKISDVDLVTRDWKLSFRDRPYSSDADVIPENELPGIIVINGFDEEKPDGGFYHLYVNTGSEEAKHEWMRALEMEMCRL